MIVVIDGPEKTGKTTIIRSILTIASDAGWRTKVIHHGKECAGNDGSVYAAAILGNQHLVAGERSLLVLDRAWPAEYVYGTLMGRDTCPIVEDPFFVEEALGAIVRRYGHCAVLLGPSAAAIAALRSPDDQPVDPGAERTAYMNYAATFHQNWQAVANDHTEAAATLTAGDLLTRATLKFNDFKRYRR